MRRASVANDRGRPANGWPKLRAAAGVAHSLTDPLCDVAQVNPTRQLLQWRRKILDGPAARFCLLHVGILQRYFVIA
jgi:hypothetical protein